MGLTKIDIGVMLLVVVTGAAAVLFTFLLWRSGYVRGWRAARSTPPTCPACGYNLTGLSECRCPECGASYRLDQLWYAPIDKSKKGTPGTVPRRGTPATAKLPKEDHTSDDDNR